MKTEIKQLACLCVCMSAFAVHWIGFMPRGKRGSAAQTKTLCTVFGGSVTMLTLTHTHTLSTGPPPPMSPQPHFPPTQPYSDPTPVYLHVGTSGVLDTVRFEPVEGEAEVHPITETPREVHQVGPRLGGRMDGRDHPAINQPLAGLFPLQTL